MDEIRRARLVERQRMAVKRRERQEYSVSFRAILPRLQAAGLRFSRLPPVANQQLVEQFAFIPIEDEEFTLKGLPAASSFAWSSFAERDGLCRAALMALTPADASLAVIWHPYMSGLRIRTADLISQIGPVLDAGNGQATWIVPVSGEPWLVQIGFWSRTVSWVSATPNPA
ncbi:MAG: hypothetical protein MUE77_06015 [Sandarakinorhabdus sp.]|jgi:hypothetical protein|nr:hypothetical protein [Sandarakinorhabdus sp.]